MDRAPGRAIYTAMLNARGGIESDLTAVRLADDHYRLYVGTTALRRDLAWLRRHLDDARVELHDRTYDYAVIGLMGPQAVDIAANLGVDDLNTLKYFTACETTIANCGVLAVRLSYVGEAGWEITCGAEDAGTIYDAISERGARPAGLFAQTAMRIEKRYLAYGHDLDTDVSPLQAGLDFAVAWDSDFIGRDALLRQRDAGTTNASSRSCSTIPPPFRSATSRSTSTMRLSAKPPRPRSAIASAGRSRSLTLPNPQRALMVSGSASTSLAIGSPARSLPALRSTRPACACVQTSESFNGSRTLRSNSRNTVPSDLKPRVLTLTMPCPSRLFDSRFSSTSVSA